MKKLRNSQSVILLASLVKAVQSTFAVHPFKSIYKPGATPQHSQLYYLADNTMVFESEDSLYNYAVLVHQIPSKKRVNHPFRCTASSAMDTRGPRSLAATNDLGRSA